MGILYRLGCVAMPYNEDESPTDYNTREMVKEYGGDCGFGYVTERLSKNLPVVLANFGRDITCRETLLNYINQISNYIHLAVVGGYRVKISIEAFGDLDSEFVAHLNKLDSNKKESILFSILSLFDREEPHRLDLEFVRDAVYNRDGLRIEYDCSSNINYLGLSSVLYLIRDIDAISKVDPGDTAISLLKYASTLHNNLSPLSGTMEIVRVKSLYSVAFVSIASPDLNAFWRYQLPYGSNGPRTFMRSSIVPEYIWNLTKNVVEERLSVKTFLIAKKFMLDNN